MRFKFVCNLLVAVAVAVVAVGAQGKLTRLSFNFDGDGEQATSVAPAAGGTGGSAIFTKSVFVPKDNDAVYITFSGTGDTHGGSTLAMSCNVDGVPCSGLSSGACAVASG